MRAIIERRLRSFAPVLSMLLFAGLAARAQGPGVQAPADLGAKIEVPTIDGRSQLKVPPGTQSGQKLRLREKGISSAAHEGMRGDQIVEVKVVVPEARDLRVRELWQELQRLNPEDPRQELWAKI